MFSNKTVSQLCCGRIGCLISCFMLYLHCIQVPRKIHGKYIFTTNSNVWQRRNNCLLECHGELVIYAFVKSEQARALDQICHDVLGHTASTEVTHKSCLTDRCSFWSHLLLLSASAGWSFSQLCWPRADPCPSPQQPWQLRSSSPWKILLFLCPFPA